MSAVALVCVRNEALHLRACVGDFVRQGVDVILIDNDSTDGSIAAIREEFLGKGLLSIERLPWRGAFSLTEQLAVKKKLIESVTHDWIIHADADEWLQAPPEYGSLMEGIRAADGDGFNCINFLEFVFLPRPGEDF
jgi:glycosyltransferase involved in cell wall biosynthesis